MNNGIRQIQAVKARRRGPQTWRELVCGISFILVACAGSASIPAYFPSDVPIQSGARVLEVKQLDGGVTLKLESADEKDAVTRTYIESLTAAGWKISAQHETPTGETMIFADKASPPRSVSVLLTPSGSRTVIDLMETVH